MTVPNAVTEDHLALQAFVGHWDVLQKQWKAPDAEPTLVKGSSVCMASLGGLMVSVDTELENGWRGTAIQTYNGATGRYELALMNTGASGIVTMLGEKTAGPSSDAILEEHGRSAKRVRTWASSAITAVPANGSLKNTATVAHCVATEASAAEDKPSLTLIENQVSSNKWVLDFYLSYAGKGPALVQQNVFTRRT